MTRATWKQTLGLLGILIAAGCGPEEVAPGDATDEFTAEETAAGWGGVSYGVSYRATGSGANIFVGYAGYGVQGGWARAWTDALYGARLRKLGVGHVYAVQGPRDPGYSGLEIGNTRLVHHLLGRMNGRTGLIVVAGHSSGSFVANEFFSYLLAQNGDGGRAHGKVVYYDLDGGSGLPGAAAQRMGGLYFASALDRRSGTWSPNVGTMQAEPHRLGRGAFLLLSGDDAGCSAGAHWCLHMVAITQRPHNPAGASAALDYSDFRGRPVGAAYMDQTWSLLRHLAGR